MYQPRSVLTYRVCPSKCIASTSRGDTQRKNLVDKHHLLYVPVDELDTNEKLKHWINGE